MPDSEPSRHIDLDGSDYVEPHGQPAGQGEIRIAYIVPAHDARLNKDDVKTYIGEKLAVYKKKRCIFARNSRIHLPVSF